VPISVSSPTVGTGGVGEGKSTMNLRILINRVTEIFTATETDIEKHQVIFVLASWL
jgi:hypothetical protein